MAYIITDTTATLIVVGKVVTLDSEDRHYAEFITLLKEGNQIEALAFYNSKKDFTARLPAPFSVVEGRLQHNGNPCNSVVSNRTLELLEGGYEAKYMLRFLDNLYTNPSKNAVDELYGFLEANDIPITKDGCFMAYKRINKDWKDVYTGTIDNSVGALVTMDRNTVDEDKHRTCSQGLHVCSLNYLKSYSGARLVAVKVNPRDVVSVPTDYQNSKMRVCRYQVIVELDPSLVCDDKGAYEEPVYDPEEEDHIGLK